jgi:hypothetical protein
MQSDEVRTRDHYTEGTSSLEDTLNLVYAPKPKKKEAPITFTHARNLPGAHGVYHTINKTITIVNTDPSPQVAYTTYHEQAHADGIHTEEGADRIAMEKTGRNLRLEKDLYPPFPRIS